MQTRRIALLPPAALLGLVLGCGGLAPAGAQPMDLETAADSPLWWTLTGEVSPADLRREFRDPEAHLPRYLAAVEAGVPHQELSDEGISRLSFYYNLRMTPELTPMWLAFNAFAGGHLELLGGAHVTDSLTEFGFGPTAIDTIILFASRQYRESQELVAKVGPKSQEFVQIQRRAIEARGGDRRAYAAVEHAAETGNLDLLLPYTDIPRSELAELRTAWLHQPATEVAEKLLPQLRQQLTDEEWQRFRLFLLEHVVASMGNEVKDFDLGKGVVP